MLVIAVGVLSFGSIGSAASTSLVINEVDYDQAGTDAAEFLELKNVSGAAINLDLYRVELINGSGGALYQVFDLPNVNLAAGGYYVVCANATTTANCNLDVTTDTNLIQNGAPDGLRLMLGTTTVDALSYEGDTAGATEGSGAGLDDTAAGDESISRCPDGADSDVNNVDFSLRAFSPGLANVCGTPPPPEPTGPTLLVNEVDYDQPGLDTAEFLELKNVNSLAVNIDSYSVELVNGSGGLVYRTFDLPNVVVPAGGYYVVCANPATVTPCDQDGGPDTDLIQNGAPDGARIVRNGATVDAVSYEGDTAGSTEGTGTGVEDAGGTSGISRCPDGVDTNSNSADFSLQSTTPGAANSCPPPPPPPHSFGACGDNTETRIHAVQGADLATPVPGEIRVVEGVVVGDYQQSGGFNGYYLQEETGDADDDAATSEGVFVLSGSLAGGALDVSLGQIVRVRGTVSESFNLTQIGSVTDAAVCPGTAEIPATPVTLPVSALTDHERTEGMKVRLTNLTVTEVFNLGRFGEVSMSGVGRLRNPTAVALPGAPAQAVADANNRSRIILDDGDNRQNIDPTVYPQGGLSATNTLRVGDTLNELNGVMDFRFSNYRIQPVGAVEFAFTNLRTPAPASVGGNLKVASFNVLNYFNGDGLGGGFPTARGAETPAELARQEAKIVSALKAIDADVFGFMEIENDEGANSALAQLVAALNAATAPGTYAFVDTGVIGTDAIKVALVYKPAKVSPVGTWDILTTADDPRFIDTRNRPTLAQTFRHTSSGQVLTVAVNHLKSKGSACGGAPDDQPDTGGGNCNGTRTAAAEALADWLATDPTGSGDSDVLLIGDLNSYTFETPIQALEAGGFENLTRTFLGLDAYTYVFNGESGYLDHALGTASLADQVTGVAEWHINPDEPTVLDYNTNFKSPNHQTTLYDPGPYRSSDHDPVIVGLQLNHPPTAEAGGPYTVAEGGSVAIAATGSDADGDALTFAWDLDNDGDFDDGTGQAATFSAATIDGPASRTVRVRVSDGQAATVDTATVNVINVAPSATFNAPASGFAGFPFTLSLTNATDAAPADIAGLTFAFDCGSGYGAFSASATAACPTDSVGPHSVGAEVRDDDGGVTEYRAVVDVIVTFDSLCALVRVYVDSSGVADSLCAKLASAGGKSDRKQRETDLHAFVNQVEAQSGKSMTATEAATLIRLAGNL